MRDEDSRGTSQLIESFVALALIVGPEHFAGTARAGTERWRRESENLERELVGLGNHPANAALLL